MDLLQQALEKRMSNLHQNHHHRSERGKSQHQPSANLDLEDGLGNEPISDLPPSRESSSSTSEFVGSKRRRFAEEQADATAVAGAVSMQASDNFVAKPGRAKGGPQRDNTFPFKLHGMLESSANHSAIRWTEKGKAWKVVDEGELEKVLPNYFKHGSFKSFIRQVYCWDFRKMNSGTDAGAYKNEFFVRGQKELCLKMTRKNSNRGRFDYIPQHEISGSGSCSGTNNIGLLSQMPTATTTSPASYENSIQSSCTPIMISDVAQSAGMNRHAISHNESHHSQSSIAESQNLLRRVNHNLHHDSLMDSSVKYSRADLEQLNNDELAALLRCETSRLSTRNLNSGFLPGYLSLPETQMNSEISNITEGQSCDVTFKDLCEDDKIKVQLEYQRSLLEQQQRQFLVNNSVPINPDKSLLVQIFEFCKHFNQSEREKRN